MSAPVKLVRESDGAAVAHACATCGRVYSLNDAFAERCCDRHCEDCNASLSPDFRKQPYTVCDRCRAKREAARDAAMIAKASRVPASEYDGPVYVDGAWNDGYLRDLDEFEEWWECEHDESDPMPSEVWACTTRRIQIPSADSIVEQATQDEYDGAYDAMPPIDALQAAIDVYNASVTAESWEVDYSRRIVLPVSPLGASVEPT